MASNLKNYSFEKFALEKLDKLFDDDDKNYYFREDYLLLKLLIIVGCAHYFNHCIYQKWEEDNEN